MMPFFISFMFEDRHYEKFFSFPLNLAKDNLYPGEKSKVVAMVFKPTEELCVKELPILKCQVCSYYSFSP